MRLFTNRKLIILFIAISLFMSACKVGRFIWYNFANITDYKIFPSRPLPHSDQPFHFYETSHGRAPKTATYKGDTIPFGKYLEQNHTVAFLIIHHDTLQFEKYYNDYDTASIVASFSMAKSITSMLIGCAIHDGLIRSVDDPITDYVPELKPNGFDKVHILHLLQMTSALDFDEGYSSPFSEAASFYYGTNLRKEISKLKLKGEPGQKYEYVSGNTQLLGLVLEKVLKGKTITDYFQEKLWTPMGMEYDGSWSLDRKKDGLEKTFCCVNARARDFAKLGRLYLHEGNWNGQQLVPKSWVETSTRVDSSAGSAWFYQYQWWLPSKTGNDFLADGLLGQYIYVNKAKDLVMVRLGEKEGDVNWRNFFMDIAAGY